MTAVLLWVGQGWSCSVRGHPPVLSAVDLPPKEETLGEGKVTQGMKVLAAQPDMS